MRAIVFDFDGPLFDGRLASRIALEATAAHFRGKFDLDPAAARTLPLLGPEALLGALCGGRDGFAAVRDEILSFYRAELDRTEKSQELLPDAADLLRACQRRGYRLGLLSSRREADLRRFSDLRTLFEVVHGRDSGGPSKPDPEALREVASRLGVEDAREVILIGDSDRDLACAQGAGACYYHAGWTGEPSAEAHSKARVVVKSIAALKHILKGEAPRAEPGGRPDLPDEILTAIRRGDLCFYAGAGISVPSGIGDWEGHYGDVLDEFGARHLMSHELEPPELLQLLASEPTRAGRLFDRFRESFVRPDAQPNPYHYVMVRARARRIWTSNYDDLLEKAVHHCRARHSFSTDDPSLLKNFRESRMIVKMNGDFASAAYDAELDWNLVFTQEQFDLAERRRPEIWRLFEDDYRNRCMVFVGVSFRDPALRRIVSAARRHIAKTRYEHLFLTRYDPEPVGRDMQEMHAQSLARLGIRVVFLPEHSDTQRFVTEVGLASRRPVVGVSGSLPDAPGPIPYNKADPDRCALSRLCADLGKELALRGFRVTSGLGPVVGEHPVAAAFNVRPGSSRFYIRQRGGRFYSGSAPVIVVPQEPNAADKYAAVRGRFVGELSLMIAMGGRTHPPPQRSGVFDEIELAMQRQVPVLIVPQVGGPLVDYLDEYLEKVDSSYPDQEVARALHDLHAELRAIPPAELRGAWLAEKVHMLAATQISSSLFSMVGEADASSW